MKNHFFPPVSHLLQMKMTAVFANNKKHRVWRLWIRNPGFTTLLFLSKCWIISKAINNTRISYCHTSFTIISVFNWKRLLLVQEQGRSQWDATEGGKGSIPFKKPHQLGDQRSRYDNIKFNRQLCVFCAPVLSMYIFNYMLCAFWKGPLPHS